MLSAEDNKVLTEVDAGTPMGELFRRFWLPAMLSEELPGPDCAPVRVRLLGEDMVAFRDSDGKVGVVDAYCPHRNAPMFFGRNEESGLRCIYHGWKFDVDGNCTDMPNCWEGESFKNRVKITSYPTFEGGDMIWLYMGPKDRIPPKPAYEFLDAPPEHRYVLKFFVNCNYLNSLENEFSDGHAAFLHSQQFVGPNGGPQKVITGDGTPLSRVPTDPALRTVVDTDFGQVSVLRRPDTEDGREVYVVGFPFWFPCFSAAGALNAPGVYPLNIKVPVDNENFVFFRYKWSEKPLTEKALFEMRAGGFEFPELIPGTYWPVQNKSNDYQIDRVKQRFYNYSGMMNTPVEDLAVLENQRGAIADRTREVLVSTDKGIIQGRRRLLEAALALADGVEPKEPWHPEAYRFRPGVVTVAAGTPVEEAIQPVLRPVPPRRYGPDGLIDEDDLVAAD
ncbi:MAG: Rieske 2Fe-2S domain-containing protein [Acidimicrobiaceae bacterium]|nr:Rieske 2Fe-2S domain-containing protein [Acidimicrobiaceae bacterium]